MNITHPDEVSKNFKRLFTGIELKAFNKIKGSGSTEAPSPSEDGSGNKLIDAARVGNLEQVNLLIENGADVNTKKKMTSPRWLLQV